VQSRDDLRRWDENQARRIFGLEEFLGRVQDIVMEERVGGRLCPIYLGESLA